MEDRMNKRKEETKNQLQSCSFASSGNDLAVKVEWPAGTTARNISGEGRVPGEG